MAWLACDFQFYGNKLISHNTEQIQTVYFHVHEQLYFCLKVAMKLAPDRKKFVEVLGTEGDIYADMQQFCTSFSPILAQITKFLVRFKISILQILLCGKNLVITFFPFPILQAIVGMDTAKAS